MITRFFPLGVTAAIVVAAAPAAAQPVGTVTGAQPTAQSATWARWALELIPEMPKPSMQPVGTTRSRKEAVEYLLGLAEAKTGGYWQQCQRLADDAYMPDGPRVASATVQWQRAVEAGVARVKDEEPPVGAQMFFDPGHESGHVVTYIGDDRVVSNLEDGTVGVVKWRKVEEWGPYLGWAPPYYK